MHRTWPVCCVNIRINNQLRNNKTAHCIARERPTPNRLHVRLQNGTALPAGPDAAISAEIPFQVDPVGFASTPAIPHLESVGAGQIHKRYRDCPTDDVFRDSCRAV